MLIIGESALVLKELGDEVYVGIINGDGIFIVCVIKVVLDMVFVKIVCMVGDVYVCCVLVE